MIQYDLTQTSLARSVSRRRLPSESELFAILVALMSLERQSNTQQEYVEMALTDDNRMQIAEFIRQGLSALLPEFEKAGGLEYRLHQLTGLAIHWQPF